MKTLQIIALLCIANSFSLYSMNDKKYMGLKMYYPEYLNYRGCSRQGNMYNYCTPSWKDKLINSGKNPKNCELINAFILLSRRPHESVEQQIQFYQQELETTTQQLNLSDIFKEDTLKERESFLKTIILQIQQAGLSGNLHDSNIQKQVKTAFNAVRSNAVYKGLDYSKSELNDLKKAVKNANLCGFLNKNK